MSQQGGSGTIFVTGCNLGCTFCQNIQISRRGFGRAVDSEEFAGICLKLQEKGAQNLNIVTGSHMAPSIAAGLQRARDQGSSLPVFWNSSAYEKESIVESLSPVVTGYLPDLKTLDPDLADRFFHAPDYPAVAERAIRAMIADRNLHYQGDSLDSGVIIRHLVIPGFLDSTRKVLEWFAEYAQGKALVSVMMQYTPYGKGPERALNEKEYEQVLQWLDALGIDGFYQELVQDEEWLPDFGRTNPFSSELSVPVWHWTGGYEL
ncbi:radical SAM protein [Spirochaetia bacterium]|nr:radical SAM protein [Spirochaetia bacterium]GHU30376.1 radical SAM protein [Spirochaetia bacterium]